MNRLYRQATALAVTAVGLFSASCQPRPIDMGVRPPAVRQPHPVPAGPMRPVLFGATGKEAFMADAGYLAAGAHRLAGRKADDRGSIRAGIHVQKRLQAIAKRLRPPHKAMEIYLQEFPVVQPRMTECRLVSGGKSYPIYAARPNLLQASVTPEQGLTGKVIYVGKGEVPDYGRADAAGKIVVMDFDCEGRWLKAFAFGAKAVIFIGTPKAATANHHVNLPANLPRFYVTADLAEQLRLRHSRQEVTVFAACKWEQLRARNVIAVLRGTNPRFPKPRSKGKEVSEAIVLAVPLDSYGEVPELSTGARGAANCAALLQITEHLAFNRPRRDIIVCFFDARSLCHMGARKFYGALYRQMKSKLAKYSLQERLEMFEAEHRYVEAALQILEQDNVFDPKPYVGNMEARVAEAEEAYASKREQLQELLQARDDKASKLGNAVKDIAKLAKKPDQKKRARLEAQRADLEAELAALKPRILPLMELKAARDLAAGFADMAKTHHKTLLLTLREEARRFSSSKLKELRPLRIAVKDLLQSIREARKERDRRTNELAAAETTQKRAELQAAIKTDREKIRDSCRHLWQLKPEAKAITEHIDELLTELKSAKTPDQKAELTSEIETLAQPDPEDDTPPAQYNFGKIGKLDIEELSWNSVQAMIHERTTPQDKKYLKKLFKGIRHKKKYQRLMEVTGPHFAELIRHGRALMRRRLAEIEVQQADTMVARALRDAFGFKQNHIVLHLSINLGDARRKWTFIQGEDSFPNTSDNIANYSSIFKAIRRIHESRLADAPDLDPRSVSHTHNIRIFAPGKYADSGAMATMFGLLNLSVMTTMDRMAREGLPADTLAALDVEAIYSQATQVGSFLKQLADDRRLSIASPVPARVSYCEGKWANNKNTGPSAGRVSAGGAMRREAARQTVVAVLRSGWQAPGDIPPGFNHATIVRTNTNGIFETGPVLPGNGLVLAVGFEDLRGGTDQGILPGQRGLITGITHTPSGSIVAAAVEIFNTRSKTIVNYGPPRGARSTTAMRALSTSRLQNNRHLLCEFQNILALYAPFDAPGTKLFNPVGMVLLHNANTKDEYQGKGISLDDPFEHPVVTRQTAHDLRTLNEYRLELLRDNRITQESLEVLNGRAKDLAEKAQREHAEKPLDWYQGTQAAAAALSRRAYGPLVAVMNDLVTAVVLLLLLAMPFAFALERLLIGTPHIYRQLGWFAVFFLATFALLYAVNPAFELAAMPIIIFLAFTIILLSVMVISILLRRLQSEVRKMQGLATTVHSADVSRLSTMLAAVSMGISTMRRRPLRTLLTAVTVLLLTFTILTFASFGSSWGLRRTYEGAMSGLPQRALLRHPLWSPIDEGVYDIARGSLTGQATVVPRLWVSPTAGDAQATVVTQMSVEMSLADETTTRMTPIAAAIGLDIIDVKKQELLADLFASGAQTELLAKDGIFLTDAVRRELGLTDADVGKRKVLLAGIELVYAGVIEDAMQSHTLLEGSSILPVDYEASGGQRLEEFAPTTDLTSELPEIESAQFVVFNVDRVVVVSPPTARRLGGKIRSLTIYPDKPEDVRRIAEYAADIIDLPAYFGSRGGVHRLIFTSLTKASGWRDLLIPVVLGGLIIFATMLGSVSDREREIYTFSSLGLAPPHVASLFFAEASMYAIIGGMGGYLLGQTVARVLAWMSSYGWVSVPTMNYSSTNAIVTILIVMGTVVISTIYPAVKASRSANPGIQRAWKIPSPEGNLYDMVFPFTVSAYDITGVVSFLNEHFHNFSDTSMGTFATTECGVVRQKQNDMLGFEATVALAPFDLGVNQRFAMLSQPSEIEGINEIRILIYRLSGSHGDWRRSNRLFVNDLRKQLLIWRSLTTEVMEQYRQKTLQQWQHLRVKQIDPRSIGDQS